MNRIALLLVPASLLAAVALTSCSDNPRAAADPTTSASATSTPTPAAGLAVKQTSLGAIIVDGTGMTAYVFDKDTAGSGTSACTGDCLKLWSPIPAGSANPTAQGVTAPLGVVTGGNGVQQVTVAGLPLYTYTADKNPGDTSGQLFKGLWHVVTASGQKVG
jgi:predicted lipoprotein with Yx(FWY)xxD motif